MFPQKFLEKKKEILREIGKKNCRKNMKIPKELLRDFQKKCKLKNKDNF